MHPTRDELHALLMGRLDEIQASSVNGHIDECPVCEDTIRTLETSVDGLAMWLKTAPVADSFEQEAACQELIARAVSVPLSPPAPQESASRARTDAPDLGRLGQYELLEKLGEGGMGTVYKARHLRLKRLVAIKVLPQERMNKGDAVLRFHREMEAVGRLRHPNIVGAHDAGDVEGTHFLVMEYVDGYTLSEFVNPTQPLGVANACELVRQAACGLDHAHQHGLVHRDIKPSNLMLADDGTVKVLDLGLARLRGNNAVDDGLTSSGQVMGTADYMAPDQALDPHGADIRADLYSLGCTLYCLLAGRPPFRGPAYGTPLQKVMAHANVSVPPLQDARKDVPAGLLAVIQRLLSKSPADRYATPADLIAAITPYCAGADVLKLIARFQGTAKTEVTGRHSTADSAHGALDDTQITLSAQDDSRMQTRPAAHASSSRRSRLCRLAAVVCGTAGVLALLGVIILQTGSGELRLAVNEPDVQITIDDKRQEIEIQSPRDHVTLTVPAGKHTLHVTKPGFDADVQEFRIIRNGKVELAATLRLVPAATRSPSPSTSQTASPVNVPSGNTRDPQVATSAGPPHNRGLQPLPPLGDIDFAAERKAAEWVLTLKDRGYVILRLTDGNGHDLAWQNGVLPDQPFVISGLLIQNVPLEDSELQNLAACRRLESLSLQANGAMTVAGVKALQHNRALTSLELMYLKEGRGLNELLAAWPALQELNLAGSPVQDRDLDLRGPTSALTKISLNSTTVTDAGLHLLAERCPNLRSISIMLDGGPRSLLPLANLRQLREIGCSGVHVTAEGLEVLRQLPSLDTFRLGSPTSDEAVARLTDLAPKIKVLNIFQFFNWDMGVSEEGYKLLERFTALHMLDLQGIAGNLTDAALLRIARLPLLKTVRIRYDATGRRYTPAGIAEFRRIRPDIHLEVDGDRYAALDSWPESASGGLAAWNLPAGAPVPANVPFSAEEAHRHQQAWADWLKQPVEVQNSLGASFRLIPPSEYTTVDGDQRRLVRVPRPFYLGVHEVTVAQFQKFAEASGYVTEAERWGIGSGPNFSQPDSKFTWKTPGFEVRPEQPVTHLTMADVRAFCHWLSTTENILYRVPGEDEWEAAARAGGDGATGWKSAPEELRELGWFLSSIPPGAKPCPQAVGTKLTSPFGLFDMLGNVWEYCDRNQRTAWTNDKPIAAIHGARGESWRDGINGLPLTIFAPGDYAMDHVGFRLLREIAHGPQTPTAAAKDTPEGQRPLLVRRGRPLSEQALVQRPEPIEGLRSWSLELATPHTAMMEAMAVRPQQDLIATGGQSGKICLWNTDGQLERQLLGHEGGITGLAFSPDGKWLASCERGSAPTARLWQVANGSQVALIPHQGGGERVAFPDNQRFVLRFNLPRHLLFYDRTTDQTRNWPSSGVMPVLWSPDGKRYVAQGSGRLQLCDSESRKVLQEAPLPDEVCVCAWSPDGQWLATRTPEGTLAIQSAATLEIIRTISVSTHPYRTSSVQWLPDSRRLLVGQEQISSGVFDTVSGERLAEFEGTRQGYAVGLVQNGEIAVIPEDNRLQFFDTDTGRKLREGSKYLVGGWSALSRDGNVVYSNWGSNVFVHDGATGKPRQNWRVPELPHGFEIHPAPDGALLAVLRTGEPAVMLLDAKTGNRLHVLLHDKVSVTQVAWSPDSLQLASSVPGGTVRIWDVATGTLQHELSGHTDSVTSLAWSPDSKRLASAGNDKSVRIWNPHTGQPLALLDQFPEEYAVHDQKRQALAWADKDWLWIALSRHVVRLDAVTGQFSGLEKFSNENVVTSLIESPDRNGLLVREAYDFTFFRGRDAQDRQQLGRNLVSDLLTGWTPDSRRILVTNTSQNTVAYDTARRERLGCFWPVLAAKQPDENWEGRHFWMCVGPTGHYRGGRQHVAEGAPLPSTREPSESPAALDDLLVYVALHEDGSQRTYTPAQFQETFGWKNVPAQATLLRLDERPRLE